MATSNPTDTDLTRFAPITTDDHAGYVWIATILGITYTLLAAFLRACVKCGMYGWDDILAVTATILHLAQSISIFVGLAAGMGKSDSLSEPYDSIRAGKVSTVVLEWNV